MQSYSIGVGKEGYETPVGDYSIRRIVWNPPWNPPDAAWAEDKEPQPPGAADNPMKVVKIYFKEPDYYIHGTGTVSSLGGAVSHGCLRMAPEDAANLARYLMEHGGHRARCRVVCTRAKLERNAKRLARHGDSDARRPIARPESAAPMRRRAAHGVVVTAPRSPGNG